MAEQEQMAKEFGGDCGPVFTAREARQILTRWTRRPIDSSKTSVVAELKTLRTEFFERETAGKPVNEIDPDTESD
jgi:hypothetical protein